MPLRTYGNYPLSGITSKVTTLSGVSIVMNAASTTPPKTSWTVSTRLTLTILGELASKANSRKLVMYGGKPRFIKSEKALGWERMALLQIPKDHCVGLTGPIRMTVTIYYASRRPDLDPSLLMDVLEHVGVYKNDRQIMEQHLYKKLDPLNPRVELVVEELT
jgi:Holliday junction resolvase RusA-like endonuclease